MKPLWIAIDGPVAAGKGTVSRLLADRLNLLYVDTGAMYRALALFVNTQGIDWDDEQAVCHLIDTKRPRVVLRSPAKEERDGRLVTVLLNNRDVSGKIRTEEISWVVPTITRYRCVRDYMLPLQRQLAEGQSVVMEGRDITSRVLPEADLKIYLTAKSRIRAQRRYKQLKERGEKVSFKQVFERLKKRDRQDKFRENDPLVKVPGVWELDTTELTIREVVEEIVKRVNRLK